MAKGLAGIGGAKTRALWVCYWLGRFSCFPAKDSDKGTAATRARLLGRLAPAKGRRSTDQDSVQLALRTQS